MVDRVIAKPNKSVAEYQGKMFEVIVGYVKDLDAPSVKDIVRALREARAVRLMIAQQENIEAYVSDLDDMISKLDSEGLTDTLDDIS